MDYRELYQRLEKLDLKCRNLKQRNHYPRVSFEYKIGRPKPDREGTLWYPVELSISPKAGFDINKIQKVIYILHPTFTPSRYCRFECQGTICFKIEVLWKLSCDGGCCLEPVNGHSEIVKLIRILPVGLSTPNKLLSEMNKNQ